MSCNVFFGMQEKQIPKHKSTKLCSPPPCPPKGSIMSNSTFIFNEEKYKIHFLKKKKKPKDVVLYFTSYLILFLTPTTVTRCLWSLTVNSLSSIEKYTFDEAPVCRTQEHWVCVPWRSGDCTEPWRRGRDIPVSWWSQSSGWAGWRCPPPSRRTEHAQTSAGTEHKQIHSITLLGIKGLN